MEVGPEEQMGNRDSHSPIVVREEEEEVVVVDEEEEEEEEKGHPATSPSGPSTTGPCALLCRRAASFASAGAQRAGYI